MPVRVEVGPRDLAEGNVTVVTRHRREKQNVALAAVAGTVASVLEAAGPELLAEATAARQEPGRRTSATLEEAVEAAQGWASPGSRMGALGPDGEDRLAEHAITVRCLQRPDGSLAEPGDDESELIAVVGRSY